MSDNWIVRVESDGEIRWLNNAGGISNAGPRAPVTATFATPIAAHRAIAKWLEKNERHMIEARYTAVAICNRWAESETRP